MKEIEDARAADKDKVSICPLSARQGGVTYRFFECYAQTSETSADILRSFGGEGPIPQVDLPSLPLERKDSIPVIDGLGSIRDPIKNTLGGVYTGNATLYFRNSPYRVQSDLTVEAGATLTIETGVQLYFDGGVGLKVKGIIHAVCYAQTSETSADILRSFGGEGPIPQVDLPSLPLERKDSIPVIDGLGSIRDPIKNTLGGVYTGNATLYFRNSPYRVQSDLTVEAGATLTIETGVQLYFDSGVGLKVKGIIHAVIFED
uniref:Sporulation protein n=1 Tax=Ascaris lumbricoides TaxID=6252 RepID=A0A0M3ILN8_ASCLU